MSHVRCAQDLHYIGNWDSVHFLWVTVFHFFFINSIFNNKNSETIHKQQQVLQQPTCIYVYIEIHVNVHTYVCIRVLENKRSKLIRVFPSLNQCLSIFSLAANKSTPLKQAIQGTEPSSISKSVPPVRPRHTWHCTRTVPQRTGDWLVCRLLVHVLSFAKKQRTLSIGDLKAKMS